MPQAKTPRSGEPSASHTSCHCPSTRRATRATGHWSSTFPSLTTSCLQSHAIQGLPPESIASEGTSCQASAVTIAVSAARSVTTSRSATEPSWSTKALWIPNVPPTYASQTTQHPSPVTATSGRCAQCGDVVMSTGSDQPSPALTVSRMRYDPGDAASHHTTAMRPSAESAWRDTTNPSLPSFCGVSQPEIDRVDTNTA